MICLVSGATPTLRRFAHLGCYGQLINPRSGDWPELGLPWACDNGSFAGFNEALFWRMLERVSFFTGCRWVTAPDVVADSARTLSLFHTWAPRLHELGFPVALVAQNGLVPEDVPWDDIAGLFVGGDTAWKLGPQAAELVRIANGRGLWTHMGRVGTGKRIRYCQWLEIDSIDGGVFSTHPLQAFRNFTKLLVQPDPRPLEVQQC